MSLYHKRWPPRLDADAIRPTLDLFVELFVLVGALRLVAKGYDERERDRNTSHAATAVSDGSSTGDALA